MLSYILEVSLCWAVFYAFYALLLRRVTFFNFNRGYLLGTLLLGLIIPAMEWEWLFAQPETVTIYLQPITVGMQTLTVTAEAAPRLSFWQVLLWMYWVGFLFVTVRLVVGTIQIIRLYYKSERRKESGYQLVRTEKFHQPFSFFNCCFLSKLIPLDADDEAQILLHEQAHIRGWHSVDVILAEVLTAIFWCSPFIYGYRRSLRTVHEYIADAAVLRTTQRKQYGHLLIRQSQSGPALALANPFHSQLKKRIVMLFQTRSSRRHLAKYLLALPLLAVLVMAFAVKADWTDEFPTSFTSMLGGDYDEAAIRQELHQAMTENVDSTFRNEQGGITFMRNGLQMERCASIYKRLIAEYPDRKTAIQKLVKEVAAANGIKFIVKDEEGKICLEVDETFPANARRDTVPAHLKEVFNTPLVSLFERDPFSVKNPTFEIYYPDGRVEILPAGTDIDKYITSVENVNRIEVRAVPEQNLVKIWLNGKEVDEPAAFGYCKHEQSKTAKQHCSKSEMLQFIYRNIKYPKEAQNKKIQGTVIVQYVIGTDGKITSSEIVQGIGGGCDEEVLRVVRMMQDWTPAQRNGKPVAYPIMEYINFDLDGTMFAPNTEKDTVTVFDSDTYEERTFVIEPNEPKYAAIKIGKVEKVELKTDDKIYTFVEEQPEYPGGTMELMKWIGNNLKYPKESREKGVEGTVFVGFVIEKDGSISNIEVKKGVENGKLLDEEAMRVVKIMPKWRPGKQSGQPIRTLFTLPIKYKLSYSAPTEPSLKIGERSLVLEGFKATPNPTSGLLNLSFKGEAKPTTVNVYDMQGKELYGLNVQDFSGSFYQQVDLSQAPKGTLILSIRQGEKVFTEKIVLQ